jgi:hypothetical protein
LKIWEELLQRLRDNEPLEVVRRECRSDSQFAKAIRVYNDEMSAKADEIRKVYLQEKQKLADAKTENKQSLAEKNILEKDVQSLKTEKSVRLAEVQSTKERAEHLRADAESLEKAGFTPDVIEVVKKSWTKNAAEVLAVLQDVDKAVELRVEVQNLCIKTNELKRSTSLQETKLQKTDKKLASKKNILDVTEAEVLASQNVVSVVKAGMKRGYTPEQMISIFYFA